MTTRVLTGPAIYPRHGQSAVTAMAIADGTVVATGSLEEVSERFGDDAIVERVPGEALLPAFVDPHLHAFLVAVDPSTDVLHRRASSVAELLDVIAREVASAPDGDGWIRLHGYEPLMLAERRSPTAAELDTIVADRPLHVLTRTFHESVVNTAGLRALGITAGTPDPSGGRIVRTRRGQPTGVLIESVSFLAEAASRSADDGTWVERLTAFGQQLLSFGILRVGDAAVPATVAQAFVDALSQVGVTAHPLLIGDRIDAPALVPGGTAKVLVDGGEFCELCMTSRQMRTLMVASVKANVGPERALAKAVGLRTGWPKRGADGQWRTGVEVTPDLDQLMRAAAENGSALAMHAVGNGALDRLLSARAADSGLSRDVPVRVEHAMTVDADLVARLADASLPVVVQPGFLVTLGHEFNVVPLPDPLRFMPTRLMDRSGIRLAFSSDYPATPLNPWVAIAAAVTRQDRTGATILPDEAVDVTTALRAHTEGGASVLGEPTGGYLAEGSSADFVVVDADPYRVRADQLAGITTLSTWRAGRPVWSSA